MSLVGLAIIGKKSEPLYLCDCSSACSILLAGDTKRKKRASDSGDDEGGDSDEQPHVEQEQQQQKPEDDGGGGDPFGFAEARRANGIRDSMSMEDRFAVHSALDRLDEAIETTTLGLPVPRGRTGAWLGLLMTVDDRNVYGYITATRIKILLLTESEGVKENEVRGFLATIHEHFISYSMNPFSNLKDAAPIDSREFDRLVVDEVKSYQMNRTYDV